MLFSLGCIEGKRSPFVSLEADHDDEERGYDDPAEDDVQREEAARTNHVVLRDIV